MTMPKAVREITEHHANLNLWAAVVTLLESGGLYGGDETQNRLRNKVIDLCKAEQQRQLRLMDRAVLKLPVTQ